MHQRPLAPNLQLNCKLISSWCSPWKSRPWRGGDTNSVKNQFIKNDFFNPVPDATHPRNPPQLIWCFQLFMCQSCLTGWNHIPANHSCKVRSWDPETGYLIGKVVASQVDESILTDGKVDLGKLKPIIFDPSFNAYRVVSMLIELLAKLSEKLSETAWGW